MTETGSCSGRKRQPHPPCVNNLRECITLGTETYKTWWISSGRYPHTPLTPAKKSAYGTGRGDAWIRVRVKTSHYCVRKFVLGIMPVAAFDASFPGGSIMIDVEGQFPTPPSTAVPCPRMDRNTTTGLPRRVPHHHENIFSIHASVKVTQQHPTCYSPMHESLRVVDCAMVGTILCIMRPTLVRKTAL